MREEVEALTMSCLIHKEIEDSEQGWDPWSLARVRRDEAEEISVLGSGKS